MGEKTTLNYIKSMLEKKEQRDGNGSRSDRKPHIDMKVSIVVLVLALMSVGGLYAQVKEIKSKYASKEVVAVQYVAVQQQIKYVRDDTKETRSDVRRIYNILYAQFGAPTVRHE